MRPKSPQLNPTIGILYGGELGSSLGRLLVGCGLSVVTTLEGRSPRTARLCQEAGLAVLPSLRAVAECADLVLSTVSPAAALAVAEGYRAVRPASAPRQLYVDLNAVAPQTVRRIADVLTPTGVDFVDGAVHGLAAQLPSRGTVYLSGPNAPAVGQLFGQALRVRVLGDQVGKASAFKMMISGMAKGVVALFVEMAVAARQAGLLDDLLACYRDAYPGIMDLVERMLPTYPRHAARRSEELKEVEQTMIALGLQPCMVHGARRITTELSRADLKPNCGAASDEVGAASRAAPDSPARLAGPTKTVREIIEAFAVRMNH